MFSVTVYVKIGSLWPFLVNKLVHTTGNWRRRRGCVSQPVIYKVECKCVTHYNIIIYFANEFKKVVPCIKLQFPLYLHSLHTAPPPWLQAHTPCILLFLLRHRVDTGALCYRPDRIKCNSIFLGVKQTRVWLRNKFLLKLKNVVL